MAPKRPTLFKIKHVRYNGHSVLVISSCPGNTYLFKVNNRNTRKRCGIWLKLIIKTPERHCSGLIIVNFEHISHLLVFLLLTLNK